MITALDKGGDRGGELAQASDVAFEETSTSGGASSMERATNGVYGHQIFTEMKSYVFRLRLASPWPVCLAHASDVGFVALFATVRVRTRFCAEITPALVHASSYKCFLSVLRILRLKSFRGARGIPETPFLHAIAACQPGSKKHAHRPACKR